MIGRSSGCAERAATVAFSGVIAFAAAGIQRWVAPDPHQRIQPYLILWLSAAGLSITVIAIEMIARGRRSALQAQVTMLAVEQFLPCLVAGAMRTYVLVHFAGPVLW